MQWCHMGARDGKNCICIKDIDDAPLISIIGTYIMPLYADAPWYVATLHCNAKQGRIGKIIAGFSLLQGKTVMITG